MFLYGLTPEEMKELGYRFYLEYVPEDEQQMLLSLNETGFNFHGRLPLEERVNWFISYDFHILNNCHPILINHKLIPPALTSDGHIWLALCLAKVFFLL